MKEQRKRSDSKQQAGSEKPTPGDRIKELLEGLDKKHQTDSTDSSDRMDDARPVQKVVNGGFSYDIGLQYLPGDDRFGNILSMGYGHLRKTRGEDGMALDCYVHPLVVSGEVAPYDRPLFEIQQLDDDGEYDESKIMIGWRSGADAERAYLKVMPGERYGGIGEIEIDDLDEYAVESELPFEDEDEDEDEGIDAEYEGDEEEYEEEYADSDEEELEEDEDNDREDAFPIAKRRWQIGDRQIIATHEPGDQRFNLGLPMRSYYGYMNGTYGQAVDGKAYDFYIDPSCPGCVDDEKPSLYAIAQVGLDGQIDEFKYLMGYPSMQSARDAFVDHAGRDRFGMIEDMDWEDFEEDEDEEYNL